MIDSVRMTLTHPNPAACVNSVGECTEKVSWYMIHAHAWILKDIYRVLTSQVKWVSVRPIPINSLLQTTCHAVIVERVRTLGVEARFFAWNGHRRHLWMHHLTLEVDVDTTLCQGGCNVTLCLRQASVPHYARGGCWCHLAPVANPEMTICSM